MLKGNEKEECVYVLVFWFFGVFLGVFLGGRWFKIKF